MKYAELQCQTHYSFLRGASHPRELLNQAQRLELQALAITDHLGVYALPKAFLAWQELNTSAANPHSRVSPIPEPSPAEPTPPAQAPSETPKLICGTRLPLDEGFSITLLAKNRSGYGKMTQIITQAFKNKKKAEGTLAWDEFTRLIQEESGADLFYLLPPLNKSDLYLPLVDTFLENTFITVHRHLVAQDRQQHELAQQLKRRFQLGLVATNDVHYHIPERRQLQDVLTCIRHSVSIQEAGYRLFPNGERYLKSPLQMHKLFADCPEAIHNTLAISEACTFSLCELRYRYPSEWLPAEVSAQEFLVHLVEKGARWRYPKSPPEAVVKQIAHELKLVEQLHFADYFLTIWDIVQFARKKNILCQGRGSAANSIICYCLGITAIDPVQMNLLFERFISVERGEPPDIDVDFEHERREEVIQYIYQKYGRHRAAMVSAVVTFRSRSVLRELSRVFSLPLEGSLHERLQKVQAPPQLCQQIEYLSRELKGLPRHLSIHSGGFTLSADPIVQIVPVEPARMNGRTIIQWDKYDLDILQLLKVDILALGMLSALKKTLSALGHQDLTAIPPADEQTYRMIQKAQTIGTFQIESRAQMNMLGRLQPRCFYDLVVQVAIVRPGPIVGQMVHPYLRRRRGLESPASPDPRLAKILDKTLGIPLFQEQVMKIAIDLAEFSPGEADQLRRAIGAWRSKGDLLEMGQRLQDGLLKSGLSKSYVTSLFQYIRGFAEYGFPESHAASFALIAYASAYLKCHHPAHFTCALLNSQPMGFYSPRTLVEEGKRQGVEIRPLDPNQSVWDCRIEGSQLCLGWRYVKGLPKKLAEKIVQARQQKLFASLYDFVQRTRLPLSLLQSLALGDAFKVFGYDQRQALWQILGYQMYLQGSVEQSHGQMSLFAQTSFAERPPLEPDNAARFQKINLLEAIHQEQEIFGLSCKGHPMQALRKMLSMASLTSQEVKRKTHNQWLTTSGLIITRQRPSTAKGVMFATLEDEFGFVDLIFHPQTFNKYEEILYTRAFLTVTGRLQKDGQSRALLVHQLRPLLRDEEAPLKPNRRRSAQSPVT